MATAPAPRRTLATVKIKSAMLPLSRQNREWLADALSTIACELLKGEHTHSLVLEIFERADGA